jgi:hypothetical protein
LAAPTNLPIQDGLPVANHDVSIDVNPISACDLADYGNDKTSPAFTVSKILFDFGKLTMTTIVDGDGNPWWVACEVCKVLGYVNTTKIHGGYHIRYAMFGGTQTAGVPLQRIVNTHKK